MTGIPAHLLCPTHRAWEALFITETCAAILEHGVGIIRQYKLEGKFDLRLVRRRMDEIRAIDGGPSDAKNRPIRFPIIPFGSSDFLGYIHPNRHISHLRRVCHLCRELLDNDARTRGPIPWPRYIRRRKA